MIIRWSANMCHEYNPSESVSIIILSSCHINLYYFPYFVFKIMSINYLLTENTD